MNDVVLLVCSTHNLQDFKSGDSYLSHRIKDNFPLILIKNYEAKTSFVNPNGLANKTKHVNFVLLILNFA